MFRMLQRSLSFVIGSFVLAGCAYRTPVVHVPEPHGLDVAEVTVEGQPSETMTKDVRAMVSRHAGTETTRVRIALDDSNNWVYRALNHDGMAILGMWPILFGMTYESETVSVDVEIDGKNGRTLVGHATAEKDGSLFAKARRRAIAAALDKALANAR